MPLRKIRDLGAGTFGRVYQACDEERGRDVAVKEVLDPQADIERFAREARLLHEQLNNRYVVDIYEFDLEAAQPYIVMEYCEGGSLRQHVGKVDWKQAATMLLHAAHGLLGIHAVGGFHRDIKPDNLLLGRSPGVDGFVVKLGDFGLARRPTTQLPPMTCTPGGTPGYMAPELSMPDGSFTPSADIYSLGVVGVELITGTLSTASLASADVPEELRSLLRRMTSILAAFRPSISDVILALGNLIGINKPPPSSSPLAPAQPRPPQPPQPRPAAAPRDNNGLLFLLTIAGLAVAGAALAADDKGEWDANVDQYRGRDGRFKGR